MNLQAMLSSDDAVVASTHAQCPASPATSTTSSSSSSSSLSENSESDPLKRGWVAPFLLHLHQMLRRENPKIIRWTDDGIAFQILDKEAMTNQILPRYFKNKNFASFQRQLNYFGFRKWSKARAPFSTYSREHFTRDNYGDMSLVKRQSKKSRKRPASESVDEQQQDAKRAAVQPYWASGDKCKPILPRPGASATEVTPSPVPVPQQVASPVMVVAAAPVESISPAAKTWSAPSFGGLLVRAPAASNPLFTLPVISPARKVANGCKLPSIHDLSFSSALNSENAGLRPRWLA
ncbi:Hsf-type dna-binding protein [Globisporangium polare]